MCVLAGIWSQLIGSQIITILLSYSNEFILIDCLPTKSISASQKCYSGRCCIIVLLVHTFRYFNLMILSSFLWEQDPDFSWSCLQSDKSKETEPIWCKPEGGQSWIFAVPRTAKMTFHCFAVDGCLVSPLEQWDWEWLVIISFHRVLTAAFFYLAFKLGTIYIVSYIFVSVIDT